MARIIRDANLCHGCRTCEMMCSFHHHRAFSPAWASIDIERNNASGNVSWSVGPSCDLCEHEDRVFCVTYCAYGALRRTEL